VFKRAVKIKLQNSADKKNAEQRKENGLEKTEDYQAAKSASS
jgi:hypothetical protein